ncbi:membrane-binding protein [Porphyromonadaceae bacterium COT-184 OH4590]|nr:membrane-binding protein [Porphyromonadaceae bacterium COT-184 OH4590]
MPKKSYSEQISQSKLLVEAMKNNASSLPSKLTGDFIEKMNSKLQEAIETNTVQERLKADLKTQTAKLDELTKEINKAYAEAKKRIKLDFPQERWKEFGFEDKK